MQAERTVTVYGGNQLDQAREVSPRLVAEQFIQAVLDGYFTEPPGRGGEWAYRLWLTAPDGLNVSWDRGDDDRLMGGLQDAVIGVTEGVYDKFIHAVWGES